MFFFQNVMEAMGVIAIIVNCYLIGQCGQLQRLIPWLGPESAIIFIVVLEVGIPVLALFSSVFILCCCLKMWWF